MRSPRVNLQPKLNLKVAQRQVLTPGLVQMVSVLALNKLELKDMINSELVENPVLEELEESNATLDERVGLEGDRERSVEALAEEGKREDKDPFDEIDFGSYFQDYLDPGFKTGNQFRRIPTSLLLSTFFRSPARSATISCGSSARSRCRAKCASRLR